MKNKLFLIGGLLVTLVIGISSCISYSGAHGETASIIAGPHDFRNQRLINTVILPYIAEVLEYNDASATDDPNLQKRFRTIPTVNDLNNDGVVMCQDYALLFWALCKHYEIPVKLIWNFKLGHAFNQIYFSLWLPLDIEPQSGESQVYIGGLVNTMMYQKSKDIGLGTLTVYTHPDDFELDPYDWSYDRVMELLSKEKGRKIRRWVSTSETHLPYGVDEGIQEYLDTHQPNLDLLNYVVENGRLPD